MMLTCSRRRADRGFTLLEVLLALALSAVVVYLIAGALDFHLRQLTVRRMRIEEAQLARAILRRIADDLRAAVVDRPADFSSAGQLAQATASGSLTTDGSSSTSGSGGATTGGMTGGADSSLTSSTTDATAGVMSALPGIYGTEVELQIDISHVPRYEEYAVVDPINQPAGMRMLSDVKTVSYFVLDQYSNASGALGMAGINPALDPALNDYSMLGLPPGQPLRGLGRRIVDRASARYAMATAEYTFLDQQFELLAPEVLFVQFRYFDGFEWLPAWDTQQFGGVPVAVEITLALRSDDEEADSQAAAGGTSYAELDSTVDPSRIYRLVVHLPAANLLDLAAAAGMTSSSTSTQQGVAP